MTNRIMQGVACALLLGTSATATAATKCDGSVGREYTLKANNAGATCWSFVTRFGPSRFDTDECYEMDRYVARAMSEFKALQERGCGQMDGGPTRGELDYTRWLGKEFRRIGASTWVDGKGWVYGY